MTLTLHILRELVADHIERLIAFLDATEPDPDLEPECREADSAESDIADMDGMLEQLSGRCNYGGDGSCGFRRARRVALYSNTTIHSSNHALWRDIEDWGSSCPLELSQRRAVAIGAPHRAGEQA